MLQDVPTKDIKTFTYELTDWMCLQTLLWELLGTTPHRLKIKPISCSSEPLSLGLLPTTTPNQDHYQPVKPLIRTNTWTVGNCPGGELSWWGVVLVGSWPDKIYKKVLLTSANQLGRSPTDLDLFGGSGLSASDASSLGCMWGGSAPFHTPCS